MYGYSIVSAEGDTPDLMDDPRWVAVVSVELYEAYNEVAVFG